MQDDPVRAAEPGSNLARLRSKANNIIAAEILCGGDDAESIDQAASQPATLFELQGPDLTRPASDLRPTT